MSPFVRLPDPQEDVAGVAERWKQQYGGRGWTSVIDGRHSKDIYAALCALPATATPKDVADVIGNDSWCGSACDECYGRPAVIQIGQEPDYESATVTLCAACVDKLLQTLEQMR